MMSNETVYLVQAEDKDETMVEFATHNVEIVNSTVEIYDRAVVRTFAEGAWWEIRYEHGEMTNVTYRTPMDYREEM